jgi:hypothetical protein
VIDIPRRYRTISGKPDQFSSEPYTGATHSHRSTDTVPSPLLAT